jgi:Domain of unknown function (DUF4293)
MIQRKQSLYLFLAIGLVVVGGFTPLYIGTSCDSSLLVSAFATTLTTPSGVQPINSLFLGVNISMVAALTLFSIFKYSNRKLQMRLCLVNLFLIVATLSSMYTLVVVPAQNTIKTIDFSGNLSIGFYTIVAAIPLYLLSFYYINKDEQLVKSIDRLR